MPPGVLQRWAGGHRRPHLGGMAEGLKVLSALLLPCVGEKVMADF